jgi:hypothetical protein
MMTEFREILLAKAFLRPVLIVDALEHGQSREYPYLGNSPIVRPSDESFRTSRELTYSQGERIVGGMLQEVLRYEHFIQHFEDVRNLFGVPETVKPLASAPEPAILSALKEREPPRPLSSIQTRQSAMTRTTYCNHWRTACTAEATAADLLGYKPAGLRKIVTATKFGKPGPKIQFAQVGKGPIRFRREWLDEFIAANVVKHQTKLRPKAKPESEPQHGFNNRFFKR